MKKVLTLYRFCVMHIFCHFVLLLVFSNGIYAQQISNNDNHLLSIKSGLSSPVRIAIDNQDNIYVTDAFRKCITKFDTSGNFIGTISAGGLPIAIAVSNDNQVIYSDNNNGHIQKLKTNGDPEEIYTDCVYPSSAVFDRDNNLYVVDSKRKQVVVMDLSGNVIKTIGDDILVFPTGIAYDRKNNRILVAEHGGTQSKTGSGLEAKILVFDPQGNLVNSFGEFGYKNGQFSRIQGLTVDKWGQVYIVDPYQGTVSVFDENGSFITRFGQFGKEPGQLNAPMDIIVDSRGRIWITSMNNGSLEVFSAKYIGQNSPADIISTDSDLLQNYPNPFNKGTWIPFVLSNDEVVTINIYNIKGAMIRTFKQGILKKGNYIDPEKALYWDGTGENGQHGENGIYFYELKLSDTRKVRRMIIAK